MKVEFNEYLVVYPGHNMAALLYQKLFKKCEVELVATPVKISYGCSKSVKFKEKDMSVVIAETLGLKTPPKGVYKIIKNGRLENYEKIKNTTKI